MRQFILFLGLGSCLRLPLAMAAESYECTAGKLLVSVENNVTYFQPSFATVVVNGASGTITNNKQAVATVSIKDIDPKDGLGPFRELTLKIPGIRAELSSTNAPGSKLLKASFKVPGTPGTEVSVSCEKKS